MDAVKNKYRLQYLSKLMSLHQKKMVANRENRVASVSPVRLPKHEHNPKMDATGGNSQFLSGVHLNTSDSPGRGKASNEVTGKLDPIYKAAVETVEVIRRSNDMLPKRKLKQHNPINGGAFEGNIITIAEVDKHVRKQENKIGSAYIRHVKHKSSVPNLKGIRHTSSDEFANGNALSLPVAALGKHHRSSSVLLLEAS